MGSGKSVDQVIEIALELVQCLCTHVTRCAGTIAGVSKRFHIGGCGQSKVPVHLTSTSDTPLIERTGAAYHEAVVDEAHVVAEIAVALVHLDLVLTSFAWLLQIGVLIEASIT